MEEASYFGHDDYRCFTVCRLIVELECWLRWSARRIDSDGEKLQLFVPVFSKELK
jgi:hypothetical protein